MNKIKKIKESKKKKWKQEKGKNEWMNERNIQSKKKK